MKKNSKSQWRSDAKLAFETQIRNILGKVKTRTVTVIIVSSKIPDEYLFSSCSVNTYSKTQEYNFYIDFDNTFDIDADITNIYINQSEMSREHNFTHMQYTMNHPFNELSEDLFNWNVDSIVSFLLENMVWK